MKKSLETIYNVVVNNSSLLTALGGDSSDTNIYQDMPDIDEDFDTKLPIMTYDFTDEGKNTVPVNTSNVELVFRIYSRNKTECEDLHVLLDNVINYLKGEDYIVYIVQQAAFYVENDDRLLYTKLVRYNVTTRDL